MADCAAIPSCAQLSLQRTWSKASLFAPRGVNVRTIPRECLLLANTYFGCHHLSLKVQAANAPSYIAVGGSQRLDGISLRCCCFGALMSPDNIVPSSWVSYVDEILLVVSVIFAYSAGAIPQKRVIHDSRSSSTDKNGAAPSSIPYGRSMGNNSGSKSYDLWGEVEGKLLDALSAYEHGSSLRSRNMESETHTKRHPLSLLALAEGSRFRLLSSTLQQLQNEVHNISQIYEVADRDAWLVVASDIITRLIQPACSKWLEEELSLEIRDPDMRPIKRISEKLKGDDTVLQKIDRSGKAELYADLLFFLRFTYVRTAFCYNSKFLSQNGVDILEDMVIMLADAIACIYLELISVDSNMSSEINATGLTLCSLSTRELQRLRNEVALNQWLLQNFHSIVSMYEDRFELSVLSRKKHTDPAESNSQISRWWKRFSFRKSMVLTSGDYVLISPISLPVKRTKELRALTGWRYYFSLFLEFTDITMPLVKTVFTKLSNAFSFFLVYMIGRSLGLIFTGIRQSLGWR